MSVSHADPHESREKHSASRVALMCIALSKSVHIRYNAISHLLSHISRTHKMPMS